MPNLLVHCPHLQVLRGSLNKDLLCILARLLKSLSEGNLRVSELTTLFFSLHRSLVSGSSSETFDSVLAQMDSN